MGERTKYPAGTFSWVDLNTTDQEGAKAFYAGLFGWEADDRPVGDGIYYSMQQIDGKSVAAISPQMQDQREQGVPPVWNSYITVESADDAAARAGELGADVHAPPFDVLDVGRMAVIQDPQGAFFMIWEPKTTIGAELVNVPGAFSWNELHTTGLDAARSFYGDLFGWEWEFEESPEPYLVIKNQGGENGGVRGLSEPGVPPHWLVYFAVEDMDAALSKVSELGGENVTGAMDIGNGQLAAVVRDPQGAVFGLYSGRLDD
jgi:uncharacterized protein